jgi:hypothetical protein
LFLNDLEEFLLTKDIVGLKSITDELETELEIYLKIFAMLYADDTIVLVESAEDLQEQYHYFCFVHIHLQLSQYSPKAFNCS